MEIKDNQFSIQRLTEHELIRTQYYVEPTNNASNNRALPTAVTSTERRSNMGEEGDGGINISRSIDCHNKPEPNNDGTADQSHVLRESIVILEFVTQKIRAQHLAFREKPNHLVGAVLVRENQN